MTYNGLMPYYHAMLIHIAVCDDEKTEREYLAALVRLWAGRRGYALNLSSFDSAESFLFAYDGDKTFDILLLDIQMKKMDGVELARLLRRENSAVQLLFITGFPDFIAAGYEVSALHYLMKPILEDKLFSTLDRAVINLNKSEPQLIISVDSVTTKIKHGDILYCESFAHSTVITTIKETYETRLPISELEKQLGGGFIRCHRSYIVGIRHIERISKTDVFLDNGSSVPLSRRSYDMVNRAFIRYYRGLGNGLV